MLATTPQHRYETMLWYGCGKLEIPLLLQCLVALSTRIFSTGTGAR